MKMKITTIIWNQGKSDYDLLLLSWPTKTENVQQVTCISEFVFKVETKNLRVSLMHTQRANISQGFPVRLTLVQMGSVQAFPWAGSFVWPLEGIQGWKSVCQDGCCPAEMYSPAGWMWTLGFCRFLAVAGNFCVKVMSVSSLYPGWCLWKVPENAIYQNKTQQL